MENALKKLCVIIDGPRFVVPWLDRFYEAPEIEMALAMEQEWKPIAFFKDGFSMDIEAVERSYVRGVLEKNGSGHYKVANFHTRYDIWVTFEGFKDIPDDIGQQLNHWEFQNYCRNHETELAKIRKTQKPDDVSGSPRYLLLDETLETLTHVDRIYLWPCNCRSMIKGCNKPVYTCLRFENNRNIGFEISREKAREIVLDANKKGLMQCGEFARDNNGNLTGAICNCCSDCCFPHQLAQEKKAEKIWPFSRYVAQYQAKMCTLCGICSRRCPFGAILFQKKTKAEPARFSLLTDLCRGCGLCATGCPTGALLMETLQKTQ